MAADGLITVRSSFGPEETMNRFEAEVRVKGMTVFAHIDHAAGAAAAGLPLRPTDLLIFGAAKGGTPLMQAAQTIGIDLPLKVLVWQDEAGTTFLSYNDPAYLDAPAWPWRGRQARGRGDVGSAQGDRGQSHGVLASGEADECETRTIVHGSRADVFRPAGACSDLYASALHLRLALREEEII